MLLLFPTVLLLFLLDIHHVVCLPPNRSAIFITIFACGFFVFIVPETFINCIESLVYVSHLLVQIFLTFLILILAVLVTIIFVFSNIKHVSFEILAHFYTFS